MKRKVIALFLCIVLVCTFCFPAYANSDDSSSDGYSVIISDIPTTCPTCGAALHASWRSTAGAEVELQITEVGKITIPAGAGVYAHFRLYCENCGYSKSETRILGLDWGSEHPGQWEVKEVPSGISRKDLPGYEDDKGTAHVSKEGELIYSAWPCWLSFNYDDNGEMQYFLTDTWKPYRVEEEDEDYGLYVYDWLGQSNRPGPSQFSYYTQPLSDDLYYGNFDFYWIIDSGFVPGTYYVAADQPTVKNYYSKYGAEPQILKTKAGEYNLPNDSYWGLGNLGLSDYNAVWHERRWFYAENAKSTSIDIYLYPILVTCDPTENPVEEKKEVTIEDNKFTGNIYVDNSTNLTYIYPQYTTVNENNETVTNISNNPIIYNNETKQYYTYDQTTKNYYYINYGVAPTPTPAPTETPTPSPDPTETPTPSPDPTEEPSPSPTPTPTEKPGGSISTPETGKPGGSSGSSWWDKLLSKIGDAIIDGLLGAVSAVLKLIFKLFSTILSWIIWAVSRVFDLLPFLPPGLGGLLVGGVVVCFVIGIIKFIRG